MIHHEALGSSDCKCLSTKHGRVCCTSACWFGCSTTSSSVHRKREEKEKREKEKKKRRRRRRRRRRREGGERDWAPQAASLPSTFAKRTCLEGEKTALTEIDPTLFFEIAQYLFILALSMHASYFRLASTTIPHSFPLSPCSMQQTKLCFTFFIHRCDSFSVAWLQQSPLISAAARASSLIDA